MQVLTSNHGRPATARLATYCWCGGGVPNAAHTEIAIATAVKTVAATGFRFSMEDSFSVKAHIFASRAGAPGNIPDINC
jgi:hypothetical protein